MRFHRALLAAALLGSLAAPAAVDAVPPTIKGCRHLVVDEDKGGSSPLDILTADFASGRSAFVAVMRLKTLNESSELQAPLGLRWVLNFTLDSQKHTLVVRRPFGTTRSYVASYKIGDQDGTTPTLKVDGDSFTWTLPVSKVPGLTKRNAMLSNISGGSFRYLTNADDAPGDAAKYKPGSVGCYRAA